MTVRKNYLIRIPCHNGGASWCAHSRWEAVKVWIWGNSLRWPRLNLFLYSSGWRHPLIWLRQITSPDRERNLRILGRKQDDYGVSGNQRLIIRLRQRAANDVNKDWQSVDARRERDKERVKYWEDQFACQYGPDTNPVGRGASFIFQKKEETK